ncbi:hypothetical protein O1611_g6955 [Lasiodiplodia mahajangana]|uniref:Uncharacterized protein n=1 Tax=Lasiodiplodia mahajangana TaxID=1108764 RepID=A0ACC2JH60_9PEZI|nr:hypothetical protein O1611_g6955 [Lasiodiplodia mahajangana]
MLTPDATSWSTSAQGMIDARQRKPSAMETDPFGFEDTADLASGLVEENQDGNAICLCRDAGMTGADPLGKGSNDLDPSTGASIEYELHVDGNLE